MAPTPDFPISPTTLRHGLRRAALPLCTGLLLAACGGGDTPPAEEAAAAAAQPAAESRRFVLWQPGREAAVRAEQARLADDPAADEVRLVVRLNPAAVPPSGRATAAAGGAGEAGDAGAQRARELAARAEAVASASQGVLVQSVRGLAPGASVRQTFAHALEAFVVTVPFAQAQAVADALALNPAVDAVELDHPVALEQAAAPRAVDPRAWGVDRIDQRARAFDGLFRHTRTGAGVTAYVVDTGVSAHGEFGTRLKPGFSAVADGQGTRDCHSHGTHVAGTVAGRTLGVAPGADVVPVRVLDCAGQGSSAQVLAGLDWIAAQGRRPGVVNLSLGSPASTSTDAAVQRLMAAGFTVVAAAGNSNTDACTQSPARAPGVITVAASDTADAKASFSNTGSCVALWAPGTAIASAGIASATEVTSKSGTSMAAPHAAGAAALLLQEQPAATAAQVRARLLQDATANAVGGVAGSVTRALLYAGDASAAAPLPAAVPVRPGSITMATAVPAIGQWAARATVQVFNGQGTAVAGVRVAGRFSHMTAELACTTAADGRCTLAGSAVAWGSTPRLGFAITGLSGAQLADSGGGVRSAQVSQPAAPVASIAALTGSMQRPTATSAQWMPLFMATVVDSSRAPVAGARIDAQITIHSGARAVGVQQLSCQTAANGQCRLAWSGPALGSTHTGAVLRVTGVTRTFLVYQPGSLTQATVGTVR